LENLYEQIDAITSEVEALLEEKKEEQCASLLGKRLELLKELDLALAERKADKQVFYQFLQQIQARDEKAVNFIHSQKKEVLSASGRQQKANQAIQQYSKFR